MVISPLGFPPAYYDWIYALMPSKRRFDKTCNVVHKFSMDVIKKRRAALQEMKVIFELCNP